MRVGCFGMALALAASTLVAEAWSPPYQTQRLYYDMDHGLRGDSSMSLDGVDAFTIRFTGVQMDWDFQDYGMLFRMDQEGGTVLLIQFTGPAYTSISPNTLITRLVDNKEGSSSEVLPEVYPQGVGLDLAVCYNGTSGRITAYVDGREYFVSVPQGDGDGSWTLPNHIHSTAGRQVKFFSGNGNAQNDEYNMKGYQESMTIWAGVALDASTVQEMHEGFYANVPTPSHHYSFCEGEQYTTGVGVLSDAQTGVVIKDHITGDPTHNLLWDGKFERFRDVPAADAENVGGECCEANARRWGLTSRSASGAFRTTVDGLSAESVDEGRRCHAS